MKKKSYIVLDLDDCYLDFIAHACSIHYHLTGEKIDREEITEWALPDGLYKTCTDYTDLIHASQRTLPKVLDRLNKFKKDGYGILFMTARDEVHRRTTEFNLAFNKTSYDKLFFNKNKSLKINRLSEEYNIVLFADDKTSTINNVKKNTDVKYVYLINTPANRNDEVEEGVIRINNLNEIKEV